MELPNDELKWFGEGFDGFPKLVPEDCIEYHVYILDSGLKGFELRDQLRKVQEAAVTITKNLLKNFIWQRDAFSLDLVFENGRAWTNLNFLKGQTNYGDSIEDEWLIVYLLRELSKQFPQSWIRMHDSDGEFLLVEAANALPHWLNPENSSFRVWINSGKLLLIPFRPDDKSAANLQHVTLKSALHFIRADCVKLVHSSSLETEAFFRLQKYPSYIEESMQRALALVPRKLAHILHGNPRYVSAAVEAFYVRDPVSLQSLQTSDSSKLLFPPADLVIVSVAFPKIGYAQLKTQEFVAPPSWKNKIEDLTNSMAKGQIDLGMKVTSGFEMLLSDPQHMDKRATREIGLIIQDLEAGDDRLPTDLEMSKWEKLADDDGWLDIDFQEFEKELHRRKSESLPKQQSGFGASSNQEHVKEIISRFKDFLNDKKAGLDGVEDQLQSDGEDDYSDEPEPATSGSSSEKSNEEITFNENEFTSMITELMSDPRARSPIAARKRSKNASKESEASDSSDGGATPNEERSIRQITADVESELRDAGAFRTEGSAAGESRTRLLSNSALAHGATSTASINESDNHEINIDLNLAKNLLESFQSQGGAAGPGGNLMGMLGLHMPRAEPQDEEAEAA